LTHNVTLVGHDWGGPLSFYRARRYPDQIKAIAYFEAIVLPRRWQDYPGDRGTRFRSLRSPEGERLVLDENFFVEVVLPAGMLRKLSDEEMEAYRAPYRDRERRIPTLAWPRELPIEGEPADVVAIVEKTAQWLTASSNLPKLFINGDPGASISGRLREFCRTLPNQREITVTGLHHLQEDSPNEIGGDPRFRDWFTRLASLSDDTGRKCVKSRRQLGFVDRCVNATRNESPSIQTGRTTCANSTRCREYQPP